LIKPVGLFVTIFLVNFLFGFLQFRLISWLLVRTYTLSISQMYKWHETPMAVSAFVQWRAMKHD